MQCLLGLYKSNLIDLEWLHIHNKSVKPRILTLMILLMDDTLCNYKIIKFKFLNKVQKKMTLVDCVLSKVTAGSLICAIGDVTGNRSHTASINI